MPTRIYEFLRTAQRKSDFSSLRSGLRVLITSCMPTRTNIVFTLLHYSTCAKKCSHEEEDCKLANADVNNVGSKFFQKSALQMFHEEGNVFNAFIRPQRYKQTVCFGVEQ